MNKQYFNINIPKDPTLLLSKLNLNIFTILENGLDGYILGYCRDENKIISIENGADYEKLSAKSNYLFGYIPYDEKKTFLSNSESLNEPTHGFDVSTFFTADGVFIYKNNTHLFFGTKKEFDAVERELKYPLNAVDAEDLQADQEVVLRHRTTEEDYIQTVKKIKAHIQNGDIYEMNYCINIAASDAIIDAVKTHKNLKLKTKAPFSAFLNIDGACVLSASPERFVNKSNQTLTSQPIKGTAKRGQNKSEDQEIIYSLKNNQKEISENVMIVDLVRNDLSKIASKSTVRVSELCKVYSFETVHQLISTIQCEISDKTDLRSTLKALFPMGSMTGAPKLSATQIIEKYEDFKREIYAGSIGFISPNNSYDFNVVIRSIVYNRSAKSLSISVGSAITINSSPEFEYAECLLKLHAIESALKY